MALNKKQYLQITLFLIGILIIFLTYFTTFKKKGDPLEVSDVKKIENKELDESVDDLNSFEDVEYRGIANGNRYVIGSRYANFTNEMPNLINMKNVECIFYLNGGDLYIVSDEVIYNNVTNDMEFTKNVKVNYLENVLFSERVNFKNEENELMVEGNVISEGPEGKLRADRMDFDLNSKKLKISMYNYEKVNIKVNLQWKKVLE